MNTKIKLIVTSILTIFFLLNGMNGVAGQTQYTVSVSASPSNGGTVIGGGTFDSGTQVTVTAAPNEGYQFVKWMEGTNTVSVTSCYTFTVPANNVNLTAVFEIPLWKESGNDIYYNGTGNVGIGTTQPDRKLTVKGTVHAEEVIVNLSIPQPDYVFEDGYKMMSLRELESFVQANKHLPGIPSSKEVKERGLNAGEMQTKLLEKIEELTLYAIDLKKQNDELRKLIQKMK